MQRLVVERVCKRHQLPGSHMSSEKKHAMSAPLGGRKILEPVPNDGIGDGLLGETRKIAESRPHPAEISHYAAHHAASLRFRPIRKRQSQVEQGHPPPHRPDLEDPESYPGGYPPGS